MSNIRVLQPKPPRGFTFPSWDRVLIYLLRFFHRLLVGWAIPVADVYFDTTR